jgi:voltage-gated potassium channel
MDRPPDMSGSSHSVREVSAELRRERWDLLARIHGALDPVFVALSAVWIALVVVELAGDGLPRSLEVLVYVIWGLFIVEFAVGLLIAPSRLQYLRARWLTALALILPAFRVLRVLTAFRVLRAARLVRSVGLLRVATSVNRGLGALGRTARRRGLGYVVAATALVIVVGAAGMAWLESPEAVRGAIGARPPDAGFADYGEALWWTAYAMTSGPPITPVTAEGRLLGWLLSVYGLAVFGYLTAILASHFIERDRALGAAPVSEPVPPRAAEARGPQA